MVYIDRLYRLNLPVTLDLCMCKIKIILQGIITAPILYAMEEFPQLCEVVDRGFDNPADVNLVSFYLKLHILCKILLQGVDKVRISQINLSVGISILLMYTA